MARRPQRDRRGRARGRHVITPNNSDDYAAAILARLASHAPPILVEFVDEEKDRLAGAAPGLLAALEDASCGLEHWLETRGDQGGLVASMLETARAAIALARA